MELSREQFHPVDHNGLQVFSIPLMMGEKSISMTGDQYSLLLYDAVTACSWDVEYIVVDCPAGFGDELKTAAKVFADSFLGSIIVVQPAHELDARRAIQLHKDLELPILGLIENMSCFQAGAISYKIFGESIVDKLGEEYEVPVFGKIPLSMKIRKQIENKDPKFIEENAIPITAAINSILAAKPQKPGFLTKIKKFLSTQLAKFLIEMAVAINTEINIPQAQRDFGYPGGTIIELCILDEDMQPIAEPTYWMIDNGKLTGVQGNFYPDTQIHITLQALKWTMLGNRLLSNGATYSFSDALRLGQMKIWGQKGMARGAFFMRNVLKQLSQNEAAMSKLKPLLELM